MCTICRRIESTTRPSSSRSSVPSAPGGHSRQPVGPSTHSRPISPNAAGFAQVLDDHDAPVVERELPAVQVIQQRAVGQLGAHHEPPKSNSGSVPPDSVSLMRVRSATPGAPGDPSDASARGTRRFLRMNSVS